VSPLAQVRKLVPLEPRLRAAAWVTRQRWMPHCDGIAIGLVRDLQARDPKRFHKFAWANHLMAYAQWYEDENELFAAEQMQPSRIELFNDLLDVVHTDLGLAASSIRSVLEIGCSQGYLLRHLEQHTLPGCERLVGIDIDGPAIEKGSRVLRTAGSRVHLLQGDMEQLSDLVGAETFDMTLAAGVLSYLNQADATAVVRRLLDRTRVVMVLAGLACFERHNDTLEQSMPSPGHAGQWLHNFDTMIRAAGGRVVRTRWEGGRQYNNQTISFAFAVPANVR
jgi:SAM-dependent methyltransferase